MAWLLLAGITTWCWRASDRAFRANQSFESILAREDVVYHTVEGHRFLLDVYVPADSPSRPAPGIPRPAILAIHGGSWIGGSKRSFRPDARNTMVTRLTAAGYVVIAVNYRLSRPDSPGWPGALEDLRASVRWIRQNAGELGIDPDRIIALGQSSGAQLAALLGTIPDPGGPAETSSCVHAVVNFYGPSDLNRLMLSRKSWAQDPTRIFLGNEPDQSQVRAADASPINHVSPSDAPMLIIHGRDDLWVPLEHSERLAEKLKEAGVQHQLIIVDGAMHGFGIEVRTQPVRDILPDIFAFLKKIGNAHPR